MAPIHFGMFVAGVGGQFDEEDEPTDCRYHMAFRGYRYRTKRAMPVVSATYER